MLVHILEGFDMGKYVSKDVVRAPGQFDPDENSAANGLECLDPSRAVQSQAEEADINTIVRNFGITGRMPENVRVPEYGDFDLVSDYRSAIEAVRQAQQSFGMMPAEVRLKFNNDPQAFLDFCSDPANLPEMRKLGLAVPEVVPGGSAGVAPVEDKPVA